MNKSYDNQEEDDELIHLDHGEYLLGDEIGKGVFSNVYIGRKTGEIDQLAIKITNPRHWPAAMEEYKILTELHKTKNIYNKFIIGCFDGGEYGEGGNFAIVMPKMFMSLCTYLDDENAEEMTAKHAMTLVFQMLCAVDRLHDFNVVHTDIKPDNILFTKECVRRSLDENEEETISLVNPTFVLTDFNTSHRVAPGDVAKGLIQTSNYRAPEVVIGMPWNEKVDIFSLGALLAEALTGDLIFCPKEANPEDPTIEERIIHISLIEHCCGPIPDCMFEQSTIKELAALRLQKPFPSLDNQTLYPNWKRMSSDEEFFDSGLNVAIMMLAVDPDNRPSTEGLLKMDVFRVFNEALRENN